MRASFHERLPGPFQNGSARSSCVHEFGTRTAGQYGGSGGCVGAKGDFGRGAHNPNSNGGAYFARRTALYQPEVDRAALDGPLRAIKTEETTSFRASNMSSKHRVDKPPALDGGNGRKVPAHAGRAADAAMLQMQLMQITSMSTNAKDSTSTELGVRLGGTKTRNCRGGARKSIS